MGKFCKEQGIRISTTVPYHPSSLQDFPISPSDSSFALSVMTSANLPPLSVSTVALYALKIVPASARRAAGLIYVHRVASSTASQMYLLPPADSSGIPSLNSLISSYSLGLALEINLPRRLLDSIAQGDLNTGVAGLVFVPCE